MSQERKVPEYYIGRFKKIEAKDVVLDFSSNNYNIGTALTYLMRAGKKPGNPVIQDLKKAIAHIEMEIEHQSCLEQEYMSSLQQSIR